MTLTDWVEGGGGWQVVGAERQVDAETVRVDVVELDGRCRRGVAEADPRYVAETAGVRWLPWTGDLTR